MEIDLEWVRSDGSEGLIQQALSQLELLVVSQSFRQNTTFLNQEMFLAGRKPQGEDLPGCFQDSAEFSVPDQQHHDLVLPFCGDANLVPILREGGCLRT
jgi:hypothetical protein